MLGVQGNLQLESGDNYNLRTTDFLNSEGALDRTQQRTETEPSTEKRLRGTGQLYDRLR